MKMSEMNKGRQVIFCLRKPGSRGPHIEYDAIITKVNRKRVTIRAYVDGAVLVRDVYPDQLREAESNDNATLPEVHGNETI